MPVYRTFTRRELAFFAIPRRWIPWIVARFGDKEDVRAAIIQADEDGGLSLLRWLAPIKSWVLSDKGKRWVGNRELALGTRWKLPDGVTDPRGSVTEKPTPAVQTPPPKPSSFFCPFCHCKSLGSDRCLDLECTAPAPAFAAEEPASHDGRDADHDPRDGVLRVGDGT